MGEFANFYNSKAGDRLYDANSFEEWLNPFFTSGVFNGEMQVTAAGGLQLRVAPGNINIKGKMRHFEEATTLTLEEADPSYARIDSIVVRRDDPGRNFVIAIVKGTAAAQPTPPALTRNDSFHELQLAEVTVGMGAASVTDAEIKDTRMDGAKCGWVAATVTEIDFTQIQRQFDAYLEAFKAQNLASFTAWFNDIKNVFSEADFNRVYTEIANMRDEFKNMNCQTLLRIPASGWSSTTVSKWDLNLYHNTVQVTRIYVQDNSAIEIIECGSDSVGSPSMNNLSAIVAAEGNNSTNTIIFYSFVKLTTDIYVTIKGVK